MSVTVNGTTGLTFGDGTTQPNAGFTGFRNLLINGNFDFWQRGASFTQTNLNADSYSADRWRNVSAVGTRTHARNAFASPYPVPGATYYLTVAPLTAGYHAIQQSIEGGGRIMSGKTYTVSFWAKAASTTNIIFVSNLDNDTQPATVTAGSNGTSTNISLTTSWAKYYYTFTVPTWDGSNANRYLRFLFGNGSGTDLPPTVDIAQIQLEQGAYFTQFEFRPLQTELSLCERYYQGDIIVAVGGGQTPSVTNRSFYQGVNWKTTFRTTPTLTLVTTVTNTNMGSAAWTSVSPSRGRFSAVNTITNDCFFEAIYSGNAEI